MLSGSGEVGSADPQLHSPAMPPSDLVGKPAPDVTLTAADGSETTLSALRANGLPTLLEFYTSW